MSQLNQEFRKTIMMVTHDPLAAARASRVLHLDKGKLVDDIAQEQPGVEAVSKPGGVREWDAV